jgi:hypothetical protein
MIRKRALETFVLRSTSPGQKLQRKLFALYALYQERNMQPGIKLPSQISLFESYLTCILWLKFSI